jgi:hypothetical protein
MVKLLIALETLDSHNSIIIIDLRVNSTGFANGQLSNLYRFLFCGVFLLQDHLDIHGKRVL